MAKKYLSLERLTEYDTLIKSVIKNGDDANSQALAEHKVSHAPANAERNIIVGIQKNGVDLTVDGNRKVNIVVPTKPEDISAAPVEHNHDDKYYTETEIDSKISAINSSIDNIKNGNAPVAEATHASTADKATNATNAENATKATQDASGNVITSTYETKVDASAKLKEAKDYTDEKIALLMDNSSDAIDSIMELADAMKDNADAIEALEGIASGKVSQSDFNTHVNNTDIHITTAERTNWNAAKTHADSAHAPVNAQANVIESIKVNGTAQTITNKGVNITVPTKTSDLTHDSGFLVAADIANKADKATTLSGYGITDAYTKTEIDEKTSVDDALSATSTKPVQNKVVNSAISALTSAVTANTSSIGAHTTAITNLQNSLAEIEDITSEEIRALFAK